MGFTSFLVPQKFHRWETLNSDQWREWSVVILIYVKLNSWVIIRKSLNTLLTQLWIRKAQEGCMRKRKRMVEGVIGGLWGDCVVWLHSASGCSNRPELKCHQLSAEKRLADSLYKHWHFFLPVIACSLNKSTQWIPRAFSNALFQFSHLPYHERRLLPSIQRVDGGKEGLKVGNAILK